MAHTRRETWLGHHRAAAAIGAFQRLAPREPFLVVKGVALAARYGWDPADVPLSDVDVRVTPRSWWRLRRAFRQDPRLLQDSPWYANLVFELGGHPVDVEATCGPPFLTRLRVEELLARAELAMMPGAEPFLVPNTTDHALLLAINLFKDGITAASESARANALRLVEEPTFELETFVARAQRACMHGLTRLVARTLAERSTVWNRIRIALGPDEHAVYTTLHRRSHRVPTSWPATVVRRLGSDSTRDRVLSLGLGVGYALSRARGRQG